MEIINGHLSIRGGCNVLNADYSVKDRKFKVGPVASTRMFCTPDFDK
jgi:heat shock protein HslJ